MTGYITNNYLASGSDDTTVKIWNPYDGTLKHTLKGHIYSINLLFLWRQDRT